MEAVEDDDNILTHRDEMSKDMAETRILADGMDHRESGRPDMAQLDGEPHCWLFHDLYDHKRLMATKLRAPVKVIHGDALQVSRFESRTRATRQGVRTKTGNPFRWFVGDKMGTAARAEQELLR